jgi:GPH family glycoside/pentoside/hexuronide:cation symporter
MKEYNSNDVVSEIYHSKTIMASYGFGNLIGQFIEAVFMVLVFFFYEAEIGLSSTLTALGFIIFAIWNAINDPILGYLTDKPNRLTKRWGRRFPWIVISFIPWSIAFLLIFSPPNINPRESPWILFAWLIITTCVFDFFWSIFLVNILSLFPEKFRDHSERIQASGFNVFIGFFGVVLGFLLPPMIIIYGKISSYTITVLICLIISLICFILMIPGIKDDKGVVDRYLATLELHEKDMFIPALKQAFKQKNFIVIIIFYLGFMSLTMLIMASFLYYVRYVLKAEAIAATLIMGMLLIGGIVSLPFWVKYTQKTRNNKRTSVIGAILMVIFAIPLSFLSDLILVLITVLLFGIGLGAYWAMMVPVYSDVIDESVILTGKRREALFGGFRFFFGRIAMVIQAVTFAVIHTYTGFVEGGATQNPLAVIGIQLHTGLIPAIFMAIGTLVFWKFYDITPEKSVKIKAQLKEMGL